ncbi:uncharacterized protein [Zea mays]|uniref:uncharacterized protein isoform X1 n=1 Tax=Zea mays TaxID=4577 RepID=UPI0009AA6474|nr:uncharacterized protein LOC103632655 isoform X1 [Zea mays]|eukprot:XP_020396902.1 uncharacterized protein LOC103632655 isoform X1 [Zea mays]
MAKPSVAVPEVGVPAAQASCTCPGTLLAYPPPRGAGVAAAVRRKCLQVELGAGAGLLGGAGAWGVESMRASSPTHARAAAALAAGGGVDVDVDEERAASWMARHPSALGRFERIVAAAEGKRIVMFLDYDGTLSPIVDDPDAAFMSETMRMAVRSVAKHFPTAIVSGRCRDKHAGVRVREAGRALLRRQPRHGHQGSGGRQGLLFFSARRKGKRSSVPAGQRVPAHDRGGARAPGTDDALHTGGQGGEQQVLRLRPLQTRRRKDVGRAVRVGEGRAAGVPEAAADARADGAGGAAQHQVGQGQGPGVPARVARLRGLQQRAARVHRRRPHRRGRLQGPAAPRPGPGRRHPRVQAPQGDERLLLAPRPRRGACVSVTHQKHPFRSRVYVLVSLSPRPRTVCPGPPPARHHYRWPAVGLRPISRPFRSSCAITANSPTPPPRC